METNVADYREIEETEDYFDAAEGLTELQRRFCEEYVIDWNATRSYRDAGYSAKNDNVAAVEGHKLLKTPKIKAFVKYLRANLAQTSGLSQLRLLKTYAKYLTDEADPKDQLAAMKGIREMLGYDAPKQTETRLDIPAKIKVNINDHIS